MPPVRIGSFEAGAGRPLFFIGGPDVLEGGAHALRHARAISEICRDVGVPYIFKCSYDKANRTSGESFRGPGLRAGLKILKDVAAKAGVPVLTDVHSPEEARAAARAVDVLQIPAFLSRQTDLIQAAAAGRPLHQEGQFLAPWDMKQVVAKAERAGNRKLLLAERGTSFGYNNLVVDMRSIAVMKSLGYPVVMDAGHGVQSPGGGRNGTASGGDRSMIPVLARAGVAAGADGLFLEVHENPDRAPCDGPNSLKLSDLEKLLRSVVEIRAALH
jgi:2-dehydro-3-deoxyphosphooctonate aldolase (KDO 8-P synthase)